jgi:hypothetical protein
MGVPSNENPFLNLVLWIQTYNHLTILWAGVQQKFYQEMKEKYLPLTLFAPSKSPPDLRPKDGNFSRLQHSPRILVHEKCTEMQDAR